MHRRSFIKNVYVGGLAFALPEFSFLKDFSDYEYIEPVKTQITSRVAAETDPYCVNEEFHIDEKRATQLLFKAIKTLTGIADLSAGVKSLFPSFSPNLRIAIKLNLASGEMPSHLFLAAALADALVTAGLKPENIIIWERGESSLKRAGFPIVNSPGKVKIIGTDTPGFGFNTSREYRVNKIPLFLTSILTSHTDYQINIGVLKHHWMAGIATVLKNVYGAVPLLDNVKMTGVMNVAKMHFNYCDPCIAELNEVVEEIAPTVLYICDGLLGMYNNGPLGPPQWVQNEIMVSHDPVAIDTLSLYRIEKKRREIGLPPVITRARYIRTAARCGMGTNNPENIEIIGGTG